MRELEYAVEGKQANLQTFAVDERGSGNANHAYMIRPNGNEQKYLGTIQFQKGPIQEVGVNGVQNEDLLAIVIDRLQGFQDGPFKCRENAIVLTHLEDALHWLQHRTRKRMARGVEGTHTV